MSQSTGCRIGRSTSKIELLLPRYVVPSPAKLCSAAGSPVRGLVRDRS
jgi:hypothetical protein